MMMPNFRNVYQQETDFKRGYMVHFSVTRGRGVPVEGIGAALKEGLAEAGGWSVYMMMQGETIP
ncbi:hypothetical protein ABTC12_19500, partial [Acinetobacter baumannii]